MSKKILFITALSVFLYETEGKAGTVTVNCTLNGDPIGQLAPVRSPQTPTAYRQKCDDNFNSCGGNCWYETVPTSSADPEEEMHVIPYMATEKDMSTLPSPTAPAEEEPQTYAPAYQPQEEDMQTTPAPAERSWQEHPKMDIKVPSMDEDVMQK